MLSSLLLGVYDQRSSELKDDALETRTYACAPWLATSSLLSSLYFAPIYVLLGLASYTDYYTYRIPNAYVVTLWFYGLVLKACGIPIHFLWAILVTLCLCFVPMALSLIFKRPFVFGWGDIKLMGACSLFLSPEKLGFFLIFSGISGILCTIILKKNAIPFAPCITIAFVWMTLCV